MGLDNLEQIVEKALVRMFEGKSDPVSDHHGLCIVIADRGHVWVGEAITDGQWVHIEEGRIIRRWGTSKGLAELAKNGPLDGTILEEYSPVKLSQRSLIALIPCEVGKWS